MYDDDDDDDDNVNNNNNIYNDGIDEDHDDAHVPDQTWNYRT